MTKAFDNLPWIARFLLVLLVGSVVGGIYRIVKFLETKNVTTLVVGILGLVTGIGNLIVWIVDVVTTATGKGISVFAD